MSQRLIHTHTSETTHRWASLVAAACLLFNAGCANSESNSDGAAGGSEGSGGSGGSSTSNARFDVDAVARDLEKTYIVGPLTSRRLHVSVQWQSVPDRGSTATFSHFWVLGDAVIVLDSQNVLTRYRTSDGAVIWKALIGGSIGRIHGVNRMIVGNSENFYVTTDGELIVLDGANGSQIDRQRFKKIASTGSVVFGRYIIYGARNGQIIWHQYVAGVPYRANALEGSITATPMLIDDDVITVSDAGTIMMIDGASTRRIWAKELLDGITTAPAAGNGAVYVAGRDQYLWAFDQKSGLTLWKHLNESPLVDSPTLIGTNVYQQVPGKGLICFEALPKDAPGGVVRWTAPAVSGSVICRIGHNLLAWDRPSRKAFMVDMAHGAVIDTVDVPQVAYGWCETPESGDIYVASTDCRLTRLTPTTK